MADCIEAYQKRLEMELDRRKAEVKDEVNMLYVQAMQIAAAIGASFNTEQKLPPLAEYYPWLKSGQDTEEKEEEETLDNFTEQEQGDKNILSPEMEAYKADMDDFIFRHNRAIRERMAAERGENNGRNDLGKTSGDHRGTD